MRLPGTPSILLLAYVLVFLPWVVWRGARRFHEVADARALPSREAIWKQTIMALVVLLAFAAYVGHGFGFPFFVPPIGGVRDAVATAAAVGLLCALYVASIACHSEEERGRLAVFRLAPRTRREWGLVYGAIAVGAVTEEVAYRGVVAAILWHATGSLVVSVVLCATAFALAHTVQGPKSVVAVFAIGLVLHGLVWVTGTLVFAMGVHAAYNVVVVHRVAREAARRRLEPSCVEAVV